MLRDFMTQTCGDSDWEVVIGLEIHAQIVSASKLFSGSSTSFGADPNTQVTLLDAGMPGALPVLNEECVRQAIKTGFGLHAVINPISIFDRKNYFYADLPLGYQISQYSDPIVGKGYLDIDLSEHETKRICITRLHLEQDAGKSIHDLHPTASYIDLNRAGVGLMEIVTEPDMRSAHEAMAFVKTLRSLLRYLGTCDGNMEQGSLRADVNISLRRYGDPLGTRAEIKNVNSIRFLGQAVEYEIERQKEILEKGGVVDQETRLFDPSTGTTRTMRSKEDAHDYRYFPDPDLMPLVISQELIDNICLTLPELPDAKKRRFMEEYTLSHYDAALLVQEKETANFYEKVIASIHHPDRQKAGKLAANWMISELFGVMNRENITNYEYLPLNAEQLGELVSLILDNTISGKIAKDVFALMWDKQYQKDGTSISPKKIVEEQGLVQVLDPKAIEMALDKIIASNQSQVEAYKAGKKQLFGFFVGQAMKELKGKGNPQMINDLLKDKIGE